MTDKQIILSLAGVKIDSESLQITAEGLVKGRIKIGEFILKTVDDRTIWVAHELGGGMGVPTKIIEKMLDEYYNENI